MLHLTPFVPVLRPVIAVLTALCVCIAASAQDTIQSGTLRPLETLPSLSPATPAGSALFPEGFKLEGLAPGTPSTIGPGAAGSPVTSPSAPVPSPAAAAPAAIPAPPATDPSAPPPLPTGASHIITEPLAQAYLYVEPYQARVEVLFDAATMLPLLLPETPAPEALTPEVQNQLRAKGALRGAEWCALSCRGEMLPVSQAQVFVVKGLPGNTLPLKEGESVPVNQAMIGFMWEIPTPPAPPELTLTWNGWLNGRTSMPIRAFFGVQSEDGNINSTIKTFRWRNMDRLPRPTALAEVPIFQQEAPIRIPVGGAFWLIGGLVFYIYLKIKDRRLPGGSMPYVFVWLLGAVLMSQLLVIPLQLGPAAARITEVADAQRIVSPLLRNVYRAFDHRAESDVYDVLERSVEGELLRRLYLETIQALTLEGREGTRVHITEFQVTVDKVLPSANGQGFVADCNWMARGLVGHWGHTHSRLNIYNARITLVPVSDEWKLTGLEVQEVRRL